MDKHNKNKILDSLSGNRDIPSAIKTLATAQKKNNIESPPSNIQTCDLHLNALVSTL